MAMGGFGSGMRGRPHDFSLPVAGMAEAQKCARCGLLRRPQRHPPDKRAPWLREYAPAVEGPWRVSKAPACSWPPSESF